jgi:hypothetical protein
MHFGSVALVREKEAMLLANSLTVGLAALCSGNAMALTPSSADPIACRVVGGTKFPSAAASAAELCRVIRAAAEKDAKGAHFAVEIRVVSPSALVSSVRLSDGRLLPDQHLAVSDSVLRPSAIKRFAEAIAAQVRKAGTQ